MTGRERITRILKREKADRIGLYEHFWDDTQRAWQEAGWCQPGERFDELFGFDIQECWVFKLTADLDFEPKLVSETEDTYTMLDGNGATLRRHKRHDSTPEHIAFQVTCREDWDRLIKPKLKPEPRRINFAAYRRAKEEARAAGRFFTWSGVNVFESIHPVCGHMHMLMGMAEDPYWVSDMAMTYAELTIALQRQLFEQEGYPDGIWYYEDMGFKERPFMSPRMYEQMIQPAHAKTIAYAHEQGLPVIMHSCGFVEPLLPGMVDAGIDCLQVIEVKAGMDPLRINKAFGDRIALMGGIDVRTLYSNDRAIILAELEKKIPALMESHNYVLHSDHSIPRTVHIDSYRYFIEKGLELGTYR